MNYTTVSYACAAPSQKGTIKKHKLKKDITKLCLFS